MNAIYIIFLPIGLFVLGLVIYFGYELDRPKKFKFKPERIYIIFDNTFRFKSRIFIGDYKEEVYFPLFPQIVSVYKSILSEHVIPMFELYLMLNDKILFISHSKEKFEKYLTKHKKELDNV